MNKAPGVPDFSRVTGTPEHPVVERTPLGLIIEDQIRNFPKICPSLRILPYVIMPDHIHFLIFAEERLPKVLGRYIGMMKVKSGQLAKAQLALPSPIFDDDFYDRILRRGHSLDVICNYINQNPYRLLVRRFYPDFFRRINNIEICGQLWQAYGNIHLLDNPFKAAVIIHRADSDQQKAAKYHQWRHLAENGGVLVSPFISPAEREIRRCCEEVGGKAILLSYEPFREREKPAAHDFKLCAEGRLLILSPISPLTAGRATFLYLNSVAECLALKKVDS